MVRLAAGWPGACYVLWACTAGLRRTSCVLRAQLGDMHCCICHRPATTLERASQQGCKANSIKGNKLQANRRSWSTKRGRQLGCRPVAKAVLGLSRLNWYSPIVYRSGLYFFWPMHSPKWCLRLFGFVPGSIDSSILSWSCVFVLPDESRVGASSVRTCLTSAVADGGRRGHEPARMREAERGIYSPWVHLVWHIYYAEGCLPRLVSNFSGFILVERHTQIAGLF